MAKDKTRLNRPDYRHLLTAGGLVAGTLGTLLLGAALRVDPQASPAGPPSVITAPPQAGGRVLQTEPPAVEREAIAAPSQAAADVSRPPVPTPVRHPAPRDVASGRDSDVRRISASSASGGGWTLQFMVTCSEDTAERVRQEVRGDDRLFLLPIQLDGRQCRQICWGTFASRELALAADFPSALGKLNAEPMPRTVSGVTP